MSAVIAVLILVGAIGALIVVGVALLPFFLGFLLSALAIGGWEHFGGTQVAFGTTAFWWVYAVCTAICYAVMFGSKD